VNHSKESKEARKGEVKQHSKEDPNCSRKERRFQINLKWYYKDGRAVVRCRFAGFPGKREDHMRLWCKESRRGGIPRKRIVAQGVENSNRGRIVAHCNNTGRGEPGSLKKTGLKRRGASGSHSQFGYSCRKESCTAGWGVVMDQKRKRGSSDLYRGRGN